MVVRNRFTQLLVALFLVATLVFALSPVTADTGGGGTAPNPVAPPDSSGTGDSSTPSDGTDAASSLYTMAYVLLVVM